MANASLGEPLGFRSSVVLYSNETTFGTPVTPANSLGICTVNLTKHSSNAFYYGPGSATFLAAKGGEAWSEWGIRFPAIQSGHKTFLQRVARTDGEVPSNTLAFGYQDDVAGTPNRSADQIAGARINTLELNLDATGGHGPLTGGVTGMGFPPTTVTTLAPATLTSTPFWSYEGVVTRAGSAYPVRSFSMNLTNNLRRDHVIPGATPGSNIRSHKYLSSHNIEVSGQVSRYEAPGVSVLANSISQFAMVLTLTSLEAGSLVLTFANVSFDDETVDQDENGIFWSFGYRAQSVAIT